MNPSPAQSVASTVPPLPTFKRTPLQGRVRFSAKPSLAQYRYLVYSLAHHLATATVFEPLQVPLEYLFGPLAADNAVLRCAVDELSYKFPCLSIEETNPRTGRLVRQGSFCVISVFSFLEHEEGSRFVGGRLNNNLLDYLPQLLTLLPAELLDTLPMAPGLLRLEA